MATHTISQIVLPNGDVCNLKGGSYSPATTTTDGLMSAVDKVKLDGIEVAGFNEAMVYMNLPIMNASGVGF